MSHVNRLGHVGSAVIQNDFLGAVRLFHAHPLAAGHLIHIFRQKLSGQTDVDKSRIYRLHGREQGAAGKLCRHILRNHNGSLPVCLRRRHGAVTLIFTQIRSVGQRHLSIGRLIACFFKRSSHLLVDQINYLLHSILQTNPF